MAQQQSGKQNFQQYGVDAPAGGKPCDQASFEKLKNDEGEDDELLVNFVERGQKCEPHKENDPQRIDPSCGEAFAVRHGRGRACVCWSSSRMNLARTQEFRSQGARELLRRNGLSSITPRAV